MAIRVADATSVQHIGGMESARMDEERVNSSLYEGGDLYVRLKSLRKHLEFLDIQEYYIKVRKRGE